MKKVYIEISMLLVGTNFTGIPRVVMEVSKRLVDKNEDEIIFLEYSQGKDSYQIIDTNGFAIFCTTRSGDRNKLRTKQYIEIEDIKENDIFLDMDTVWKNQVRRSYLYKKLKGQGVRILPFVQDIIGITHPQFCPMYDRLNFIDFIGAILAYAEEIIVTTNTTEYEILRLAKSLQVDCPTIHIVPLGANFSNTSRNQVNLSEKISDTIQKAVLKGPFLLMVGTIEPRKNHKLILDAYDAGLHEMGINIIFAGFKGWNNDALFQRMENHENYGNGIWHIEGASDVEIAYLYQHCYVLAFPSYVEGYGLPIIEAFSNKIVVIASDTRINKEVAGNYGVYFQQDNPEDFVKQLQQLLANPKEYQGIKEKLTAFALPTWDLTAEGIGNIIKDEKDCIY